MDITYFAVKFNGKDATGKYETTLNGEGFHTDRALIETTTTSKAVTFITPWEGQLQRHIQFQIPLGAGPGTYRIDPHAPGVDHVAMLQERKKRAIPDPNDPITGYITLTIASEGELVLSEWNPATKRMKGHFKFSVRTEAPKLQVFTATFDLKQPN